MHVQWSRAAVAIPSSLIRSVSSITSVPNESSLQSRSSSSATQPTHNKGALKGIKVLDLTRVLAGPFCTQLLAEYGADVIKVEQPGLGDETRTWKTQTEAAKWFSKSMSLYFSAVNRNKRSITLDLKHNRGKSILHELVKTSDIFVENFIPGKLNAMGLGYADLSAINPRLIYASISGYGNTGPYANRGGYDAIAAAEGGLMSITGFPSGPPLRPGLGMTDMSTGLLTHGAILAALHARDNRDNGTGRGQHISTSLFETQLSLLTNVGTTFLNTGVEGRKHGAAHPQIVPYNTYRTGDGRWLALGANSDRQFRVLCERFGKGEWAGDERYGSNSARVERREEVDGMVAGVIGGRRLDEWVHVLEGSGLAYGPVNSVGEALGHEQAEARGMVEEVECEQWAGNDDEGRDGGRLRLIGPAAKFSDTKAEIRRRAPLLGEHTKDVLGEIGYRGSEIERLSEEDVT